MGFLSYDHGTLYEMVELTFVTPQEKASVTLRATREHIVYIFKGENRNESIDVILSPKKFDAVTFGEVKVGDALGFYTGSDIRLVYVETVGVRTKAGAYVVLLEGGGLPFVEDVLASSMSVVSSELSMREVKG